MVWDRGKYRIDVDPLEQLEAGKLVFALNLLNNGWIMDKGPVQVWLTSVFSLLAAIVGGWIAGRYAVHAQKHAVKE